MKTYEQGKMDAFREVNEVIAKELKKHEFGSIKGIVKTLDRLAMFLHVETLKGMTQNTAKDESVDEDLCDGNCDECQEGDELINILLKILGGK